MNNYDIYKLAASAYWKVVRAYHPYAARERRDKGSKRVEMETCRHERKELMLCAPLPWRLRGRGVVHWRAVSVLLVR